MKQIYCDLCNSIIPNDYKKFKVKVKDYKKDSNNKSKWKKIDMCTKCYNKLYTPSYDVRLNGVDDAMKKIFNGQGLEPIKDIPSTGIRTD